MTNEEIVLANGELTIDIITDDASFNGPCFQIGTAGGEVIRIAPDEVDPLREALKKASKRLDEMMSE